MIFVTVGTTPFEMLIQSVDVISNQIDDKILCQIATGKYVPKNCDYFRFKPSLEREFKDANLVICHGGAGTLFKLMKLHQKVISVPNLERKDKHQVDLIDTLSGNNYIIPCYDLSELKRKIIDAKRLSLQKYRNPESRIAEEIMRFIGK
jgi:beta-1,4-N-acetylglucosaminyltransferase